MRNWQFSHSQTIFLRKFQIICGVKTPATPAFRMYESQRLIQNLDSDCLSQFWQTWWISFWPHGKTYISSADKSCREFSDNSFESLRSSWMCPQYPTKAMEQFLRCLKPPAPCKNRPSGDKKAVQWRNCSPQGMWSFLISTTQCTCSSYQEEHLLLLSSLPLANLFSLAAAANHLQQLLPSHALLPPAQTSLSRAGERNHMKPLPMPWIQVRDGQWQWEHEEGCRRPYSSDSNPGLGNSTQVPRTRTSQVCLAPALWDTQWQRWFSGELSKMKKNFCRLLDATDCRQHSQDGILCMTSTLTSRRLDTSLQQQQPGLNFLTL